METTETPETPAPNKEMRFLKMIEILQQPLKAARYTVSIIKLTEQEKYHPIPAKSMDVFTVASWDDFLCSVISHDDLRHEKKMLWNPQHFGNFGVIRTKREYNNQIWRDMFSVVEYVLREDAKYDIRTCDCAGELLWGLQPDFVFVNEKTKELRFIVETRLREEIETGGKLSDFYNSGETCKTIQIVREVYSYLSKLNLHYAILTTYYQTWFMKLDNRVLYISDTIRFDSVFPSVAQCIAYFMYLGKLDTSPRPEKARLFPYRYGTERSTDELSIEIDRCISSKGRASVYQGQLGSEIIVVKICDGIKRPDLFVAMQNEISVYLNYLKELQGKVIPKFYFDWDDGHRYAFAIEYISGTRAIQNLTSDRIPRIIDALTAIHTRRVKYRCADIRGILRNERDEIYLVGFSLALANCNQEELQRELKTLKVILTNKAARETTFCLRI